MESNTPLTYSAHRLMCTIKNRPSHFTFWNKWLDEGRPGVILFRLGCNEGMNNGSKT